MEMFSPRIKALGKWESDDLATHDRRRRDFLVKYGGLFGTALNDSKVIASTQHRIEPIYILPTATSIAAFIFGIYNVYQKAGYSEPEIADLLNSHINIRQAPPNGTVAVFAYNPYSGFQIYVDLLKRLSIQATQSGGYSSLTLAELDKSKRRPLLEMCEIAGVEEAAHSLYFSHNPQNQFDYETDPTRSVIANHFAHPAEQAALKWKRNYALRFMPDIAQGFVDFEKKLASGAI